MKAKRRYINQVTTPPVTAGAYTITAQYNSLAAALAAAQATGQAGARYALLKGDKRIGLIVMTDDGGASDLRVAVPVVLGGQVSDIQANGTITTGATFPGRWFDDGTGALRRPGLTFAISTLINGVDKRTTGEDPTFATWAQYRPVLAANPTIDVSNHSSLHSPTNPAAQIMDADAKLQRELGVITRTVTVPGGYGGYAGAAFAQSIGKNLQVISDGYGGEGNPNAAPYESEVQYLDCALVPVPNAGRMITTRRFMNQQWGPEGDSFLAERFPFAEEQYNQGKRVVFGVFDHGPTMVDAANFDSFFDRVAARPENIGGKAVWYYGLQEFAEYEEFKVKCPISAAVVSGNTVTWTINKAALPSYSLHQDASLVLPATGLVGVSTTGADSTTVNTATGLVNIYCRHTPTLAPVTTTPLAKPASVSAFATSSTTINTTCGSVAYASGYACFHSQTPNGTYEKVYEGATANFTHQTLAPNSPHYYKWQAIGIGQYSNSPFSDPAYALTPASSQRYTNTVIPVDADWDLISGQNPARATISTLFTAPLQDTPKPPDLYGQVIFEAGDDVYQFFPKGQAPLLKEIWFGGWQGDLANRPFTAHGIRPDGSEVLLLTFAPGVGGIDPPEPTPGKGRVYAVAPATYIGIRWRVVGNAKPWYIRLWGDYSSTPARPVPNVLKEKLREGLGTNVHPPALLHETNNPNERSRVPADKLRMAQRLRNLRIYLSSSAVQAYGYEYDLQGYNLDAMVRDLSEGGVNFLICLENLPDSIYNSFDWAPGGNNGNRERIGVRLNADPLDPASWREWAEIPLQLTYRWGSNPNIDPALVKSKTGFFFPSDPNPEKAYYKLIGMGWMKRISPWNEWEKYWKGRESAIEPEEAAVAMGVVYDLIKEADPTMEVVFPGYASPTPDFLARYILACERLHGYKEDGSIDLKCDTLEMHIYPSTVGSQYGDGPSQAMCIEASLAPEYVRRMQDTNHNRGKGQKLVVGEIGRDASTGSALRAVVPPGSPFTQREWIGILSERDVKFLMKKGASKIYHYQWEDREPNDNYTQFSIMGEVYEDGVAPNKVLKGFPSLNLKSQVGDNFGEYRHHAQLNALPEVDEWRTDDGAVAYSLCMPTENNLTGTFPLDLGSNGGVEYIHSLDSFVSQTQNVNSGVFTATEKTRWFKKNP